MHTTCILPIGLTPNTPAGVKFGGPGEAQQKGEKMAGKKEMSADAKRGRYLAQITGCNDCHTPGYAPNESRVDEKPWLTGDILGWRGPWGTPYPANPRLVAQNLTLRTSG